MPKFVVVNLEQRQDLFTVDAESAEKAREMFRDSDPYFPSGDCPFEQTGSDESVSSELLAYEAGKDCPPSRMERLADALRLCLDQMTQAEKMFREDHEFQVALQAAREVLGE